MRALQYQDKPQIEAALKHTESALAIIEELAAAERSGAAAAAEAGSSTELTTIRADMLEKVEELRGVCRLSRSPLSPPHSLSHLSSPRMGLCTYHPCLYETMHD